MSNTFMLGRVTSLCALAAMLLTACSMSSPSNDSPPANSAETARSDTSPYADEFDEAMKSTDNSFIRSALSDYAITDAEYAEAVENEARCLQDHGFEVQKDPNGRNGIRSRSDISNDEQMKLTQECSEQSGLAEIEPLYWEVKANPHRVDWRAAERDCLVEFGVLEKGTTVEEMDRWLNSGEIEQVKDIAYVCSQDPLGYLGLKEKHHKK